PFSFENARLAPDIREQWRHQFGYDRPLIEQYVRYVGSVAQGKLGFSHSQHMLVVDALAAAVPRTLLLMGLALALSYAIGMWLGVFEATHWRTRKARASNAVSLLVF